MSNMSKWIPTFRQDRSGSGQKKNPDPHIVFMILSQNDAGILGRKTQSETTFSETIWSEITTVYLVRKYFVRITSSGMAL